MIKNWYAKAYTTFNFKEKTSYKDTELTAVKSGLWLWWTCEIKLNKNENKVYEKIVDFIDKYKNTKTVKQFNLLKDNLTNMLDKNKKKFKESLYYKILIYISKN